MFKSNRPPLGPFALYVKKSIWIGSMPKTKEIRRIIWHGMGISKVPIFARQDGFIIFEFDKSPSFCGGEIPEFTLEDGRRVPAHITKAEAARDELAYRRINYMNAFLISVYSSVITVQKAARWLQEPVDPSNYFGARAENGGWKIFGEHLTTLDYPTQRSDIIQIDTLENALRAVPESC